MARFLVDLSTDDLRRLDEIARRDGRSRAAVVREALSEYLGKGDKQGFERYFGLWARHGSTIDGLDYERGLRAGWPAGANATIPDRQAGAK